MKNKLWFYLFASTICVGLAFYAYDNEKTKQLATASSTATDKSVKEIKASATIPMEVKDNSKDRVVAAYDGNSITKSKINNELKKMFGGKLPGQKSDFDELDHDTKNNIARSLVLSELLDSEATKSHIEDTAEFKEQIENYKKHIAHKQLIDKKAAEYITEEKLKANYETFIKEEQNKEEVKARHILVSTEQEAHDIYKQLKNGAQFEEIAKKSSLDSNKETGGDLGYFREGMMVKPFEEVAFKLKVGEISEPVKTDFGWHIIKVDDKRKIKVPEFTEVKPKLEKELFQKFIQGYTTELLEKVNAKFFLEVTKQ
jgi:parvulin-like peptidyl-prolyl isomerase